MLAGPSVPAHDDDDDKGGGTKFLGEIAAIQNGGARVPPGDLPNPRGTAQVITLAGGGRIIVISGIRVKNLSLMAVRATVSGRGTVRPDGSIVATQITFEGKGAAGRFSGQVMAIHLGSARVPNGALPNPKNTAQVLILTNGERIIVISGIPVKHLKRMAVGATASGEGTPRLDGSIIATKIEFDDD
jgi:hypothetical protein